MTVYTWNKEKEQLEEVVPKDVFVGLSELRKDGIFQEYTRWINEDIRRGFVGGKDEK